MLMRRKERMRMSRICDRVYGVGAGLGSVSVGARTFPFIRLGRVLTAIPFRSLRTWSAQDISGLDGAQPGRAPPCQITILGMMKHELSVRDSISISSVGPCLTRLIAHVNGHDA